ncbi:MAG: ISAzo13 family transposase, partial [Gemmatimonadetes bacterium]|nr:ISAzo13 family transposase [Gemmatimonadota bacterium]
MTGVKWSRKNPGTLSDELKGRGIEASPNTVANVMCAQRYSLRVNRKSIAETRHPDRDRQFRYLATVKQDFLERGQPVISNDSKKRELVG